MLLGNVKYDLTNVSIPYSTIKMPKAEVNTHMDISFNSL